MKALLKGVGGLPRRFRSTSHLSPLNTTWQKCMLVLTRALMFQLTRVPTMTQDGMTAMVIFEVPLAVRGGLDMPLVGEEPGEGQDVGDHPMLVLCQARMKDGPTTPPLPNNMNSLPCQE